VKINEKLATARAELMPRLLEMFTGAAESDDRAIARGSLMARPVVAFLRPHFDRRIDRWIARPSHDLDREFAGIVSWAGSFRSDDADALLVTTAGTVAIPATDPFVVSLLARIELERQRAAEGGVQREGLPGGADPDGQEHPGDAPAAVGPGAPDDLGPGRQLDDDGPGSGDVLGPPEGDEPQG
jgi:hypothetical protein